jgi:hypothetical protein
MHPSEPVQAATPPSVGWPKPPLPQQGCPSPPQVSQVPAEVCVLPEQPRVDELQALVPKPVQHCSPEPPQASHIPALASLCPEQANPAP